MSERVADGYQRAAEANPTSERSGFQGLLETSVDDRNPALPYKDPKLWELWYKPYCG